MINGEDKWPVTVTFFKESGKYYSSGIVNLPDHWEITGGDADDVIRYIADRQEILGKEAVLRREFCMVINPTPDTDNSPEVRYLYPRMIPAASGGAA